MVQNGMNCLRARSAAPRCGRETPVCGVHECCGWSIAEHAITGSSPCADWKMLCMAASFACAVHHRLLHGPQPALHAHAGGGARLPGPLLRRLSWRAGRAGWLFCFILLLHGSIGEANVVFASFLNRSFAAYLRGQGVQVCASLYGCRLLCCHCLGPNTTKEHTALASGFALLTIITCLEFLRTPVPTCTCPPSMQRRLGESSD